MKQELEADHREIDLILKRLDAAFEAGIVSEAFDSLDLFWARLAMHIRAEHLHLFPAVLKIFTEGEKNKNANIPTTFEHAEKTLILLRAEHNFFMDELAAAIKEMRRIVFLRDPSPAFGLPLVRERIERVINTLESHNEIEETEVYRWAEDSLCPVEKAAMTEKIIKELNNLPQRFAGRQGE